MYNYILCPIDGSPTSRRGMQEAVHLAADQRAKLCFLHVVDFHFIAYEIYGTADNGTLIEALRETGTKVLAEAQEAARAAGVDADAKMEETATGNVGDVIVQYARQCPADIIVMGTHGRRGVRRLLMGSDAETVIRTSPVPVLLLRGDGGPESA